MVLEDDFTTRSVLGVSDSSDSSSFAFVEDLSEFRGRGESSRGRNRLLDRKVLFSVKEHHRREVGKPVDWSSEVLANSPVQRRESKGDSRESPLETAN